MLHIKPFSKIIYIFFDTLIVESFSLESAQLCTGVICSEIIQPKGWMSNFSLIPAVVY